MNGRMTANPVRVDEAAARIRARRPEWQFAKCRKLAEILTDLVAGLMEDVEADERDGTLAVPDWIDVGFFATLHAARPLGEAPPADVQERIEMEMIIDLCAAIWTIRRLEQRCSALEAALRATAT